MAVDTMTSVAAAAETMGHQVRLQVISYLDARCRLVKPAEMSVSVHKTNSTWPSFQRYMPIFLASFPDLPFLFFVRLARGGWGGGGGSTAVIMCWIIYLSTLL